MSGSHTFKGYYRNDGSVGTANYWIVIPMVFCENRNVNVMREAMLEQLGFHAHNKYAGFAHLLKESYQSGKSVAEIEGMDVETYTYNKKSSVFTNVDGISFLTHQGGCGGTRQDANALCGLLAGYITNPNVAGATVLSLGCQNAQVEILLDEIKKRDAAFDRPLYVLDQQQTGIETDLVSNAIRQTFYGLIGADRNIARSAPLNKICIGIEMSATDKVVNAVAESVSEKIIAAGGTVILSGAFRLKGVLQEHGTRFANKATAQYFSELVAKYEHLFSLEGINFQKSIDGPVAQKYAGNQFVTNENTVVAGVLDYPEKATKQGLNLLFTSDDRIEATTALAGSGATVILSAGGNAVKNPVVPVIKISDYLGSDLTSEAVAEKIIDVICNYRYFDADDVVTEMHNDFIPWKRGISL